MCRPVHLCWVCVRVCRYPWKPEDGVRAPGAGGIGSWEPTNMDVGIQTQIQWDKQYVSTALQFLLVNVIKAYYYMETCSEQMLNEENIMYSYVHSY